MLIGKFAIRSRKCLVVLHGKNGRGNEDGDLFFSVDDGFKCGAHGHFCFAIADIAADEPVHRFVGDHVFFDSGDGEELVFGFGVGKVVFEVRSCSVSRRGKRNPPLHGSFGVHAEQILRIADDRFLGVAFGLLPAVWCRGVQCRDFFFRADVAADEIGLRDGDEELALFGIFER